MRISFMALRVPFCILALMAALVSPVAAQSQAAAADLTGTVSDSNRAVVAGATVTVRNLATNFTRNATTDKEGRFQILTLPPGSYEVAAEAQNFSKAVNPSVTLTVGQSAQLNFTLQVGGVGAEITVTSATELIETTKTAVTQTIDSTRIENLPINGRNYLNFALTTSVVNRDNAPSIGPAPTSGLNFGGQRARSNNVQVDGADNNDNSVNAVRSTVSQEAVQEFQIITNSYAPEFGRAAGGVVNIVTKSGTNKFHGNVYGFIRHKSFQARNPFSLSNEPAFTRGQFGATFGGPIKKDRTFFFASYERTQREETGFSVIGRDLSVFRKFAGDKQAEFAGTPNVFDAFGLTGGFLGSLGLNQAALAGLRPGLVSFRNSLVGLFVATGRIAQTGINPFTGQRRFLTGALIPASYVPLGGTDPTGFPLNGEFPLRESTAFAELKFDHQINSRNSLSIRTNGTPSTVTGIQTNAQNQVFGQNAFSRTSFQKVTDIASVVNVISSLSNTVVNEGRFNFANRNLLLAQQANDVAVNINGFGFFGREPFAPVGRSEVRYQMQDNLTWTHGNHNFKFGADVNVINVDAVFELNFGGLFNFGELSGASIGGSGLTGIRNGLVASLRAAGFPQAQALQTAVAVTQQMAKNIPGITSVQAYGLGAVTNFIQGFGDPKASLTNTTMGYFAQDSWKLRRNLTFNYGVRYDAELTPTFATSDLKDATGRVLIPAAQIAAAQKSLRIVQGIRRDYNNVAPRVALAWDPQGNGKMVVRAAYGLFYDHPLLALAFNSQVADGIQAPQLIISGASAGPLFLGTSTLPGFIPSEQRFDPRIFPGFAGGLLPFTLPTSGNFVYEYAQQGNLTIEREIAKDLRVSASYLVVKGTHLNRPRDINLVDVKKLLANRDKAVLAGLEPAGTSPFTVGSVVFSNPTLIPAYRAAGVVPAALTNFFRPSGGNPFLAATPIGAAFGAKPGLPFGPVIQNESTGNSIYNALSLNVEKRFSRNYQFLGSYTYSRAIDDSTDLQTLTQPQNNNDLRLERGLSSFDQRHRFVFSGVYTSPLKFNDPGWVNKWFADWTIAPILEASSGRPFNIITGVDTNLDLSSNTDRPNLVGPGSKGGIVTPFGVFKLPREGQAGSLGRNTGVRPKFAGLDLRVSRRLRFGERFNVDIISEVFNLFNRVNVSDVNNNFKFAGQPSAAFDPRQYQFAIKMNF